MIRGLAIALGAAALAAWLPATAAARPVDVTAMTFNIASAVETDNALEPIAGVIDAASPDAVGLQEVDRSWSRSGSLDQPRELGDMLGMSWSFDANLDCAAEDLDGDGFCQYGTAILTRYVLRASATRQYRLPRPTADEQRGLAEVGVTIRGRRVTVFNTHLSVDVSARRQQVRYILRVLAAVHGPFVMLGDFNARPDAPEIHWLDARLVDAAKVAHVRRPTVAGTRIDYVFASRGVKVLSARVPAPSARPASDHRPLIARLRIG
ncbi:MAG: endonuclease/exonuclease/phosphatase family protein [Actinomycetota bacterium]|nr:endonuclease/exonuclease/phosphatase family protein [Actinomycetota bacterium]